MSQPDSRMALLDSTPEVHLRPIRPEDVEHVKAIELSWPLLSHWDVEVYRRIAHGKDSAKALIAEQSTGGAEAVTLGFLIYRSAVGETEILNVAVDSKAVRKGIGTRMLHGLLQLLGSSRQNIFLEVRPSNASAREFYFKEGFVEVGRRKEYYSNPVEDAILMRLSID
ncbi:MAG: ribosomal protein S18-alanine N-acetyltransferase [Acidobacteriia bacterium]|nr:ribosomal protein S18-alanine N-acetyltransferase [Terriglobia bacterium]